MLNTLSSFLSTEHVLAQFVVSSNGICEVMLFNCTYYGQCTVRSILMADMPCREIPCRLITTGHIRYLKWFPLYFPPSQRYLQPHRHVVTSSIVKRRFKIFSKSHFLSPTTKGNRRGGGEGGGHKNLHWSHCWLNWRAPWEKWKQIHTLESERA